MKRWFVLICLLLIACGSDEVLQDIPIPVEPPKPVVVPVEETVTEEPVEEESVEAEVKLEEPKMIPKEIEPLYCLKLQDMSTSKPEALPDTVALVLAVGTDQTKKGVYDLGRYHRGMFRIGRQGLNTEGVPVAIKLRGPGMIRSEPMDFTFQCDNQTYETYLPAMTEDIIFYVDTYGRLYWRDDKMDGTGTAMDAEKAMQEKYRYT
ncbi:MAG: hypothetical protein ACE5FT_00510 [Candidatus Nanoarchaeia archaeon]